MSQWKDRQYFEKDMSKLENQLAVFSLKDKTIYKLTVLDFRGNRFELSGQRKTIWLTFKDGILFNLTDEKKFDELYQIYRNNHEKCLTKEYILKWLKKSDAFLCLIGDNNEEIINETR